MIDIFLKTQKVVFKLKFKYEFEENLFMLLNIFICQYNIFAIMEIYNKYECSFLISKKINIVDEKNEEIKLKKERISTPKLNIKKREIFIYILILGENVIHLLLNIFYNIILYKREIVFSTILFGSTINYILAEYYPIQKIKYLPLSRIISLSNIIFRILEILYSLFKKDKK